MGIGDRKGSGSVFKDGYLSILSTFFAALTVGATGGVVQSEAMYSSGLLFP